MANVNSGWRQPARKGARTRGRVERPSSPRPQPPLASVCLPSGRPGQAGRIGEEARFVLSRSGPTLALQGAVGVAHALSSPWAQTRQQRQGMQRPVLNFHPGRTLTQERRRLGDVTFLRRVVLSRR